MSTAYQGRASEVVVAPHVLFEELGLGEPKRNDCSNKIMQLPIYGGDSVNDTSGLQSRHCIRAWVNGPLFVHLTHSSVDGHAYLKKSGSVISSADKFFKGKKTSHFGKEKKHSSPYLNFRYKPFRANLSETLQVTCFDFFSKHMRVTFHLLYGVSCKPQYTEKSFIELISKLRLGSQTKRSSSSDIEEPTVTKSSPKVNNAGSSVEERLAAIKRLLDKGLISEDEAKAKRQEILSKM